MEGCPTCSDELAFIRVVGNSLEEGVGKQAAAAMKGGQVPDDAAAIATGSHTLIAAAGLHLDAIHRPLVLLHNAVSFENLCAAGHPFAGCYGLGVLYRRTP